MATSVVRSPACVRGVPQAQDRLRPSARRPTRLLPGLLREPPKLPLFTEEQNRTAAEEQQNDSKQDIQSYWSDVPYSLRRQLDSHECISPTPTTTTVSDHASGYSCNAGHHPTAQVFASPPKLAHPTTTYADGLFFADDSAHGPGDDRYLIDLVRSLPNPENGHLSDSFGLEAPIPVTCNQTALSQRNMQEPDIDLWQHDPPSMDHWMITPQMIGDLSEKGSLPDSDDRVRAQPHVPMEAKDNQDLAQGEPGDFLETIRFFCETSNHPQGDLLNIQASSDKHTLLLILGNIEELGQKAAAVGAREPATSCPFGVGSRQEQYIRMLTRVAVMGAVDIVDDLVKYNMRIHNITPSGVHEVEPRCDDIVGVALVRNMTDDTLEGVLSLVRLDFALRQFSLFLSTDQGDMDRCQTASNGFTDMAHSCRGGKPEVETTTLTRMAQTREQLWALVGGLRNMW
ncbi:hypothetical protein V8F06_014323 [Rhypophila decipiens]